MWIDKSRERSILRDRSSWGSAPPCPSLYLTSAPLLVFLFRSLSPLAVPPPLVGSSRAAPSSTGTPSSKGWPSTLPSCLGLTPATTASKGWTMGNWRSSFNQIFPLFLQGHLRGGSHSEPRRRAFRRDRQRDPQRLRITWLRAWKHGELLLLSLLLLLLLLLIVNVILNASASLGSELGNMVSWLTGRPHWISGKFSQNKNRSVCFR